MSTLATTCPRCGAPAKSESAHPTRENDPFAAIALVVIAAFSLVFVGIAVFGPISRQASLVLFIPSGVASGITGLFAVLIGFTRRDVVGMFAATFGLVAITAVCIASVMLLGK